MEHKSEKSQERILTLLESLPQPGQILLDSVGDGLSGFSLRPKSIPQKLTGTSQRVPRAVELQLMKDGNSISESLILLKTQKDGWQQWINKKSPFVIRAEDVEKETDVVEERERNFNRNLLHEFLDQLCLRIVINVDYRESIIDSDDYPFYFWDKPVSVSGCARSSEMHYILATLLGLESHREIEVNGRLYLRYWHFLSTEKRPFMRTVIKWHKALISLYHLMKRDDVDLPLDFLALEKNCRAEIDAAATSQEI